VQGYRGPDGLAGAGQDQDGKLVDHEGVILLVPVLEQDLDRRSRGDPQLGGVEAQPAGARIRSEESGVGEGVAGGSAGWRWRRGVSEPLLALATGQKERNPQGESPELTTVQSRFILERHL
jgi:hypothetical protein